MHKNKIFFSIGVLAFSLIAISLQSAAQQLGAGILRGEVTDAQGAVVIGANITVRQMETGVERTAVTNKDGLFIFNDAVPGAYEVRASAPGFNTAAATASLQVGQQIDLKLGLSVKTEKTTIQVKDEAPQVNTVSSVVDGVVDSHQIANLPLNGRNFLELALLMPGNTIAPNFDPTKANTVVISSAGQLGRGGNVSIDGMDDNDDVVGGMLLNVPEDAVQE